jgi:hypothetical protein
MLPPEISISMMDRLMCPYLRLIRKYRISDELVLILALDNRVVVRHGARLNALYWSLRGSEARLLAGVLLKVIKEDEPARLGEPEFDWLVSLDLTAHEQESSALDGIDWFGHRTDQRYRIGDRKMLLVGEFWRGGRFRLTEPGSSGEFGPAPRTVDLTPRVAELTARTILGILDNREPIYPE